MLFSKPCSRVNRAPGTRDLVQVLGRPGPPVVTAGLGVGAAAPGAQPGCFRAKSAVNQGVSLGCHMSSELPRADETGVPVCRQSVCRCPGEGGPPALPESPALPSEWQSDEDEPGGGLSADGR